MTLDSSTVQLYLASDLSLSVPQFPHLSNGDKDPDVLHRRAIHPSHLT